jgi:threonine dehydrogenase-like Zn-dependent dehydrogenase
VHAQRYIRRLLEHSERSELDPSYYATHVMDLADAQEAYETFKQKRDERVRVVFEPNTRRALG